MEYSVFGIERHLRGISQYNRPIRMKESVDAQWAQVENQLKRRYDLIPNLVETVKGYAAQEKTVFLGVAEARKAYFQAQSVDEKARAATGLEGALSRLLLLQERYPALKSSENFLKLQDSPRARRTAFPGGAQALQRRGEGAEHLREDLLAGSSPPWRESARPRTSTSPRPRRKPRR